MNNTQRIAAGAGIAVFVTLAAMVSPGGWGDETPVGVEQSTSATPFPTSGTVPVVTVRPSAKSSVRSSGASADSRQEKTHDSSANAPYGDAESVRKEARIIASHAASLTNTGKTVYIKGYSFCGWKVSEAQRCIDQGKLTRYKPAGVNTLAGHNYKGWYWIDDIPTGRIVVIQSGALKGKYKVYGHAKVYNKQFPKSGLGAAVALQTCEGSGIGFSFLRRV